MKRVISCFLVLCLSILICSCDNTEEVVDTRSLEEIISEKIADTHYKCEAVTNSRLDNLNVFLKDNQLDKEFVPKELVRIWDPLIIEGNSVYDVMYEKYPHYLSQFSFEKYSPIYVYSFEGKLEIEKLKEYLVLHTLSYPFSDQDINVSYKYAAYSNNLFITRFPQLVSKDILDRFSLEFEAGTVKKENGIHPSFLVSGRTNDGLLNDKFDLEIIKTHEEYNTFIEKITNYENDCIENQNMIFNWVDNQSESYLSLAKALDSKIDSKTFEEKNLLFIQVDLEKENYYPISFPEFYIQNETLEIRNMIELNIYDTLLSPLYLVYLIDKSITFKEKKFAFYSYETGLDWIPTWKYE